jgi:4-diphosphocytidyl-2C-methyl-D-erythritol kinase
VIVTSVTVRVPAKVNLQLAVGPLRPDGYHGLVTVFHAVSLFDEVTVAPAEADTVTVSGEGAGLVPEDGDNLALRAVRALRQTIVKRRGAVGLGDAPGVGGVAVTIDKRIPVAGGMAGGSADAAAALVACNELWGTRLSQEDLGKVAGDVGSDAAFAVVGGTAIGRGRGEQLTPVLPAVPAATYHWVLAFADGHLSTAKPSRRQSYLPGSRRRSAQATRKSSARRSATTCKSRRSCCSPRCARPWTPDSKRAHSARSSPARVRPASSWPAMTATPPTWRQVFPVRESAAR